MYNKMTKYGFVFDMDGVIIHSNPFHKQAIRQFVERHGYVLTEDEMVKKIYGRTNKEWISDLIGKPENTSAWKPFAEEKESIFRTLYKDSICSLTGLVHFVQRAKEASIPMCVATSAPRANVDFVMENTKLRDFFSFVLDESHVQRGKPDPEIYLQCADRLSLPPSRCIVFEDSLSGVVAARSAGCFCVGVTTTHSTLELKVEYAIADFQGLDPVELIQQVKQI